MIIIDKLLIYLGDDLIINEQLSVRQPSIIEIARFGENKYFNIIYLLCSIPSDFKSELWDMGYNYNDISDFENFIITTRNLDIEDTKLIFGDQICFKNMEIKRNDQNQQLMLYDPKTNLQIDELVYTEIVDYLRIVHDIHPKRERAANKETLDILITEDRNKKSLKKESSQDSFLLPLISSMVNSSGFKYNLETLKNINIYAFMDSVRRIQAITTATSITNGMYGGMLDISKNKNLIKQLDWLRDLSKENRHSSNVTVSST